MVCGAFRALLRLVLLTSHPAMGAAAGDAAAVGAGMGAGSGGGSSADCPADAAAVPAWTVLPALDLAFLFLVYSCWCCIVSVSI